MTAFYRQFGWPEAPTSVPEHVVFQCTNGVVLGLFSATLFEERFGRVTDGFRGVTAMIACDDSEAVDEAHERVRELDDVFDLDERPDASGWGRGFSFRDPEGNVWDVAFKYGAELDHRGGFVYP